MSKNLTLGGSLALAAVLSVLPVSSFAAPGGIGACCQKFLGCCPPSGDCRISTSSACVGINDIYIGDGSDCVAQCVTTTTTLPATGACCLSGGGCSVETEATCAELGAYQGDGVACEVADCALPTTTTTTIATTTTTYLPTTTLPPTTTTTEEPIVPLCGDANNDKSITAADALIALKASVGSLSCSVNVCDYNGSDTVTTSDALAILKVAVGQLVVPQCPIL